jgi:hypothetical protein
MMRPRLIDLVINGFCGCGRVVSIDDGYPICSGCRRYPTACTGATDACVKLTPLERSQYVEEIMKSGVA